MTRHFLARAVVAAAGLAAVVSIPGGIFLPAVLRAQSASGDRPRFEVASIKPCGEGDTAGDSKSGGAEESLSPGRLHEDCRTLLNLIQSAYVLFANGHVNPRAQVPVEGGPAWIRSERYRIDAKADSARGQAMLRGPMLQTLLEERFQLKIHRETKQVPAYALTVAKGGPKLRRFRAGSCTPLDLSIFEQFPPPPLPKLPPGQKYCGGTDPGDGKPWIGTMSSSNGPNLVLEAKAMSLDEFIKNSLARNLDRPVINRTGIGGLFDFHLEFAAEEPARPPADAMPQAAGPSIFTALQRQLGLRLQPSTGPAEFLVIDRVERPAAN